MANLFIDLFRWFRFRFRRGPKPDAPVEVDISLATDLPADWKTLAPIAIKSDEGDLLSLAFDTADCSLLERHQAQISCGIMDPSVHIFKAVLRATGKPVGYGQVNYHHAHLKRQYMQYRDQRFGADADIADIYCKQVQDLHVEYLDGKEHVSFSGVYVLPEFKEAVQRDLVKWAFAHFGLEKEYIWTMAAMDHVELFSSLGWEDVGFVEVDLSEWKGKNRGYGRYRAQAMIRKPGRLVDLEASKETCSL